MYIPTIEEIEEQIKYEITTRHPLIRDFSPVSMLSILTGIVAGQTYLLYERIDDSTKSVSILTATVTTSSICSATLSIEGFCVGNLRAVPLGTLIPIPLF